MTSAIKPLGTPGGCVLCRRGPTLRVSEETKRGERLWPGAAAASVRRRRVCGVRADRCWLRRAGDVGRLICRAKGPRGWMRAGGMLFACGLAQAAALTGKPNVLHVLLDDFGWADAGWHRPPGYRDVQSPAMDALVKDGIKLERHYVFQFCSPTRSAIQSGRNPIHVNTLNGSPDLRNPANNETGFAGIPRRMTGIAEVMKRGGYSTVFAGKWDAGMATPEHTPLGRGYETSLCYFHHVNDAWNHVAWSERTCPGSSGDVVDLWSDSEPARNESNRPNCSQDNQIGCVYEDQLFANHVYSAIRSAHNPFFIFWAPRVAHSPLQVPDKQLERFAFINDTARKIYHAMVYWVDEAIGNVTNMLKQSGQYANTLMVVHADNGGPIYYAGCCGGNNHPLKGGKLSNWEGGIRSAAFVSGGLVPKMRRGISLSGLMAGWDWYATYAKFAGQDPTDHRAASAGLPPIDSHDLWPYISGKASASPRVELAIGDTDQVGGLIVATSTFTDGTPVLHKVLVGELSQAGWTGPVYPNTSLLPDGHKWDANDAKESCEMTGNGSTGCLFEISSDEGEHVNLATQMPDMWTRLVARLKEINRTFFRPDRGVPDPAACAAAVRNGGYWGPWVFNL